METYASKVYQNRDNIWNKSSIIYYKDPLDEAKFEQMKLDVAADPIGQDINCILFSDVTKNFVVQNFELKLSPTISIDDMNYEELAYRSSKTANMVAGRYGADAIICIKIAGRPGFVFDSALYLVSKNEEDNRMRSATARSIIKDLEDPESETFKEIFGSATMLAA